MTLTGRFWVTPEVGKTTRVECDMVASEVWSAAGFRGKSGNSIVFDTGFGGLV